VGDLPCLYPDGTSKGAEVVGRTLSHTQTAEQLGAGGKVKLSPAASGLFEVQRVGVALGPGFPIGLVGIGLLVALDRLEIPISMISGTRTGAVIGALYAAGAPAREIRSWVVDNLADEKVSRRAPRGGETHLPRTNEPQSGRTSAGVDSEITKRISDFATCLKEFDARTAGMSDGELMAEFPRFAKALRNALEELSARCPNPETATEVLKESVGNLPELINQSPFMNRALRKPRGYAGDDRLLNYLYDDEVLEAPTNMGKLLNYAFFSSPAANAIRNRAKIVQGVIFDRLSRKTPLHVTSVASGPAHEVSTMTRLLPRDSSKSQIIWTLLDQDQKALDNAREAIPSGVIEPKFVKAGLWEIVKGKVELGEQDVVYSLGLFDYVEHRTAVELVRSLYGCLAIGGLMLIGNFHPRNPYRALMEGAADWFLIHRTEDELLQLGKQGAPEGRHFVMAEPEGVNLILVTSKPLAAVA